MVMMGVTSFFVVVGDDFAVVDVGCVKTSLKGLVQKSTVLCGCTRLKSVPMSSKKDERTKLASDVLADV